MENENNNGWYAYTPETGLVKFTAEENAVAFCERFLRVYSMGNDASCLWGAGLVHAGRLVQEYCSEVTEHTDRRGYTCRGFTLVRVPEDYGDDQFAEEEVRCDEAETEAADAAQQGEEAHQALSADDPFGECPGRDREEGENYHWSSIEDGYVSERKTLEFVDCGVMKIAAALAHEIVNGYSVESTVREIGEHDVCKVELVRDSVTVDGG